MTWTKRHAKAFDKARWEVYQVIITDPDYEWVLCIDVVQPTGEQRFREYAVYPTRDEAIHVAKALSQGADYPPHVSDSGNLWTVLHEHIPCGDKVIAGWNISPRNKTCQGK